jgi:hypothetical protein
MISYRANGPARPLPGAAGAAKRRKQARPLSDQQVLAAARPLADALARLGKQDLLLVKAAIDRTLPEGQRLVLLDVDVPLMLPSGAAYHAVTLTRVMLLELPELGEERLADQPLVFDLSEPALWPGGEPIRTSVSIPLASLYEGQAPYVRRQSRPIIVHPPELSAEAAASAPTIDVHVHVPEQPPPVVNVNVPEPVPRRVELDRDSKGRLSGARTIPVR